MLSGTAASSNVLERAIADRVEHPLGVGGIDHADMPAGESRVVFEVEQAHGAAHSWTETDSRAGRRSVPVCR